MSYASGIVWYCIVCATIVDAQAQLIEINPVEGNEMKKIFAKNLALSGLILASVLINKPALAARVYVVNNSDHKLHSVNTDLNIPFWGRVIHSIYGVEPKSTRLYDDVFSKFYGKSDVYVMKPDTGGYLGCQHGDNPSQYYFVRITVENAEAYPWVKCTFNFHN
jgi:hypothetical protein